MPFHCIRCKTPIDPNFKACPHCGEPVTDFLRRYLEEPVDGKYEIVDRLGAGGMGDVYKVRHTYLGALRVIKVIRPQISTNKEAHERFLREARLATKVQHPNVATLHDFSALPDGSHYMVWEFIDGENLAQRLKTRNTIPPRYAVQLAIQTLHGLDAIHRAGIVHRDISPENLMITRDAHGDERVKIIDLGVAKGEESVDAATRTGMFVGKFRYASPEHLGYLGEGDRIDGRADLYSLAIVLYEMLSGRPPFEATSPHEYIMLHSRDTQIRPLDIPAGLPGGPELERILKKALERDRNKRFANARELARALEDVERSLPDPHLDKTFMLPAQPGDATMRLTDPDTLHRPTVRSEVAPPTVLTPTPGSTQIAPQRSQGSWVAFAAFVTVIVLLLTVAGFSLIRFFRSRLATQEIAQSETVVAPQVNAQTTTTAQPAAASQTSVEVPPVVATETTTTQETATAANEAPIQREPVTTTHAPKPKPLSTQPPPREESTRREEPVVQARTYVEGGDSDANDAALEELRRQLAGVTSIAIRGSGDPIQTLQLSRILGRRVTISDGASVVIQFDGNLERLGRGKKRRSVDATVTKNGRPLFRYQLAPEEYRVGDDPAEAFARVFLDALEQ